ncbi:molybdopterin-guanine dinucleotide biosynthesis protein B [Candidatus Bathyarchaeota archaeon]|nr:MAG: molybdopterin-guanine dinucleotide biosynthesis protein B [Candidatus Bathyarchaeota archaeon]
MGAPGPARLVVAVVGEKGSGKTRVVEGLVRALRARGLRVCTAKHVPEEGFSLDKPGKDSWRHAEAGASAVTLVAPGEVSTIRRAGPGEIDLDDMIALASEGCDILIMEGFSSLAGGRTDILKVVVVKEPSRARAVEGEGRLRPILAFVGPGRAEGLRAPYLGFGDLEALADRIARLFYRARPGARLFLGGREVPLKPFVRELLGKLVLAFASCLKGVEICGDEEVAVYLSRRTGRVKKAGATSN